MLNIFKEIIYVSPEANGKGQGTYFFTRIVHFLLEEWCYLRYL